MNEVTQCAGPVSTNARSHQLRWGDQEWALNCCCALRCLLKLSSPLVAFQGSPSLCNLQNKLPLLRMPTSNICSVVFHCRGKMHVHACTIASSGDWYLQWHIVVFSCKLFKMLLCHGNRRSTLNMLDTLSNRIYAG